MAAETFFLSFLTLTDRLNISIEEKIKLSNQAAQINLNILGSDINIIDFFINKTLILEEEYLLKIIKNISSTKIIFTNGCFDIIHVGHIEFLNKIREKYKEYIIIIGLNSDKSIRKIKGEKRPTIEQKIRAETLKQLRICNFIVLFDEENPYKLLKKIKPYKIIKGGKDYNNHNVIGNDLCEVEIIDTINNYDTSKIIKEVLIKNGARNNNKKNL